MSDVMSTQLLSLVSDHHIGFIFRLHIVANGANSSSSNSSQGQIQLKTEHFLPGATS